MTVPNADMHKRSGAVHDADPLVAVLYDLLRDYIQPGDLEVVVREACESATVMKVYSNGWLAAYAQDIAKRIRETYLVQPPTSPPVLK